MKKVLFIILNYNSSKYTIQCINSLKTISKKTVNFFMIIDNGSTVESLDEILNIKDIEKNIIMIKNNNNLGFAKANNIGINYAIKEKMDYVCLLNNDTKIIDSEFVTKIVDIFEDNKDIIAISPVMYFEDMQLNRSYGFFPIKKYINSLMLKRLSKKKNSEILNSKENVYTRVDYISGACMIIKLNVKDTLNFLDEDYFFYCEDMQFAFTAKKENMKVGIAPNARLIHFGGGSTNEKSKYNKMLIEMEKKFVSKNYTAVQKIEYFILFNIHRLAKIILD